MADVIRLGQIDGVPVLAAVHPAADPLGLTPGERYRAARDALVRASVAVTTGSEDLSPYEIVVATLKDAQHLQDAWENRYRPANVYPALSHAAGRALDRARQLSGRRPGAADVLLGILGETSDASAADVAVSFLQHLWRLGTGTPRREATVARVRAVTPGSDTTTQWILDNLPWVYPEATARLDRDGPGQMILLPHLIEAALDQPIRQEFLDDLSISLSELKRAFREAITDWDQRQVAPSIDVDDSLPAVLAGGVSHDRVDPYEGIPLEADSVGVRAYVTMLATVMARGDTPLPLSIGLFGAWGSGKSTFMGLLRQQVRELGASGDDAYLADVVHISFNAWSYADTNLWASLADEIFGQLAAPRGTGDDPRAAAIRAELDAKGDRARELEAARTRAAQESARLRAELSRAGVDRGVRLREVVRQLLADREFEKLWRRIGVSDVADQARIVVAEVDGAVDDTAVVRRALGRWRFGVLLLGSAAIAGLVAWLRPDLDAIGPAVAFVSSALASALAVVVSARRALSALGRAATRARTATDNPALRSLREAEAQEQVLQAQLDEVVARAGELGRELVDLAPGQRLYTFLSERAASADYRGQLGLISTIRRDFETLVGLLRRWRAERDPTHRPIDRIVLYIDDLDRCSPQQVVDVLQAVHLLLALDLFVVVVGVDPRWLLHSLEQRHPGMVGDGGERNYLEKIFNIPFVLPGMTDTGFERLVRSLAPVATSSEVEEVPAEAAPPDLDDYVPEPGETYFRARPDEADPVPVEAGSEVAAVQRRLRPPSRPLTEPELVMLASLSRVVRTPRETKRLLNVYRMLRSTQDLGDASRFLGDDATPGEYQAVVVLLGVLAADPVRLGDLLAALPRFGSWPELVAHLDGEDPWTPLLARLAPATALVTLADLAAFQRWSPHVIRFSFSLASPA